MPPPLVAFDARDAHLPVPYGSGLYARRLSEALAARAGPEWALWFLERGGPGPELVWEQILFPLALRRRRPALVHTPNCFLPLSRPCPGVVTIHDLACEAHPEDYPPLTGWKFRTFTRRAARSAERVICDSHAAADDVAERYGVPAAKLRVIPLAPSLPSGGEPPPEGPYLLYAGDLRPKKNVARLVAAWELLRAEGLPHRLVLAGRDFGEGAALTRPGVELTGFVSDARLDALMRGADLLVHPSLYEGFGLVVVEAMARGVPVALARATALPETGGDAAVLFDPHDPADMARAISEGLDRSEELVARGRARVTELSWERTAEQTLAVYAELV